MDPVSLTILLPEGTALLLPDGSIEPVVHYDLQRDLYVTESGSWRAEDIEDITGPVGDQTMDEWLDGPDFQVVRPAIYHTTTTRCSKQMCPCRQCYVVETISTSGGSVVASSRNHFRDNETCHCYADRCACAV